MKKIDTTYLRSFFSQAQLLQESQGTLSLLFYGVKISFFEFHYPLLQKLDNEIKVQRARIDDIVAMKINAIAGRGSKKDFIDIYCVCKHNYTLLQCVELF